MKKSALYIDAYEITDGEIIICALKGDIQRDYKISVLDFEAFVDRHDKREYCSDTSDYRGEHLQDSGTMPWEIYYESDYVKADLLDYLESDHAYKDIKNNIGKIVSMPSHYSKVSNF